MKRSVKPSMKQNMIPSVRQRYQLAETVFYEYHSIFLMQYEQKCETKYETEYETKYEKKCETQYETQYK